MLRFIPLIVKQVVRHRTRSTLTIAGVATAMFLFCAVQAMQSGVRQATQETARDTTLVVYRENRYCPFTSRLPEHYHQRIAQVSGVQSVVPVQIVVNNCRAGLDVITFRGVPEELFAAAHAPSLRLIDGSLVQWSSRTDAALVGEALAARRRFKVGDRFTAAGVTVYVAGIVRSEQVQDQNVAYVHLPFLQRATHKRLGIVTQFNVKVDDPARLEEVAAAIDAEFRHDPEPTSTRSEKAFVARAAADVVEMVSFTRWLAWGCLAAVLALVANAIVLAVQDRIREHALLQTLGYTGRLIGVLIVGEGLLLGLAGGAVGVAAAWLVGAWGRFTLSSEGLSIPIHAGPEVAAWGLLMSVLLGVLAGVVPAWQASRRPIAACFRAG